jgi:hypothetical protein
LGAGGATTGGVKRFPPVGLMLFSVGAGAALVGGAVVVVVVVVVVVDDGAWFPLVPQAAENALTAISTAPPANVSRREPMCYS